MPLLRESIKQEELEFWRYLYSTSDFNAVRKQDYIEKLGFFVPEIITQEGLGIDLGCGLMSIWDFYEGKNKKIFAIDPLMTSYNRIHRNKTASVAGDGEYLPIKDNSLDWIFCVNVLDHTSNPKLLVSEIQRTLKPNGTLYLEVHFDDRLGSAHYMLWNDGVIDKHLADFKLVRSNKLRLNKTCQTLYTGIYKNG